MQKSSSITLTLCIEWSVAILVKELPASDLKEVKQISLSQVHGFFGSALKEVDANGSDLDILVDALLGATPCGLTFVRQRQHKLTPRNLHCCRKQEKYFRKAAC